MERHDRNSNVTTIYNDERGNVTGVVRCRDADTRYTDWYTYAYNSANVFDPTNDQLNGHSDGRSATFVDGTYHTTWFYDSYGQQIAEAWPHTDEFPTACTGSATPTPTAPKPPSAAGPRRPDC